MGYNIGAEIDKMSPSTTLISSPLKEERFICRWIGLRVSAEITHLPR